MNPFCADNSEQESQMTVPPLPRRTFPCNECPWRRDTVPGQFPAERYEALRETAGQPGAEAPLTAPMFACHKGEPGTDEDVACAGWLAVAGREHIGVRVALSRRRLPVEALEPGPDWPALFDSYAEMARTQGNARTADAFQPPGVVS